MSKRWRFTRAEMAQDPALNYALDLAIAEHVADEKVPDTVRLWQPGRCLAVGRFDNRLPQFQEAVRHMKSRGVVLVRRMSGGKAVWQDHGYLNFSVIAHRRSRVMGIPEAYQRFSEGLSLGLRDLGLETEFKHVAEAFCDGPYDLAVRGKKLVGTAQVQRRGCLIVHGTILVDCDLGEMIEKISEFYERAGQPIMLRKQTMTTLVAELGRLLSMEKLTEALHQGFQSSLGHLLDGELCQGEWQRAHEWLKEVTL
jgi:octanoyl-[GcvH]:protein N-octanoyltransferase